MELILTIGISGSGKSTWAKQFMKENPSYLRINRDDIRKTLCEDLTDYYKNANISLREHIVDQLEEQFALVISKDFQNIILDNTNLDKKYIKKWIHNFAEAFDYDLRLKLFDIDPKIAKERVMKRDGLTLKDVGYIDKQHRKYNQIEKWIGDHLGHN